MSWPDGLPHVANVAARSPHKYSYDSIQVSPGEGSILATNGSALVKRFAPRFESPFEPPAPFNVTRESWERARKAGSKSTSTLAVVEPDELSFPQVHQVIPCARRSVRVTVNVWQLAQVAAALGAAVRNRNAPHPDDARIELDIPLSAPAEDGPGPSVILAPNAPVIVRRVPSFDDVGPQWASGRVLGEARIDFGLIMSEGSKANR